MTKVEQDRANPRCKMGQLVWEDFHNDRENLVYEAERNCLQENLNKRITQGGDRQKPTLFLVEYHAAAKGV